MRRLNHVLLFLLWGYLVPTTSPAFYFRLDGDRLWLQAEQTPLVEILSQFSRAGVEVGLDPRIESKVTGSVRGAELDHALESLLDSYDYMLTWKMLRGPLGLVPKLKEIRVFMPGRETATHPMPKKPARFDTTRGVSGTAPEFVKDELLVAVRAGTTYERFQRLLDEIGGMIIEADPATGVYLIRFPPGANVEAILQRLARHPLVAGAELNYVTRLPPGTADEAEGKIVLPPASRPADGSIPVAVLDSGLNPRAGLAGVISAGWDAVEPGRSLSDPEGHGTQMAYLASGLIAANGLLASSNVLPVVSVRTFDEDGKTTSFAIMQALAYAAKAGAKVVNMSWGSETDSAFMKKAMQVAAGRGMILVAAAGNTPNGKSVYPAAYPNVIAVGGVGVDGQPWKGSNYGSFVDLSAPAYASFPVGHKGPAGAYVGTSISSAVVAHALVQYLNRNSGATSAEAVAALNKALSPGPSGGYGRGVLDAAAWQRFLNP